MRILLNFKTVLSISIEPVMLQDLSLQTLKNSFEDETVPAVLEKLYPFIFTTQQPFNNSGLFDVFVYNKIPLKNINLSCSKLDESILKLMVEVETLDLSNINAVISDSMFENKPNLKELILNNCDLKEQDFEIVDKIVTLERLCISKNKNINIKTETFARVIGRLTHLDISDCNLDYTSFQFIFEHADNLVSLNYSQNNLNELNNIDSSKFKRKLEILRLSNCNIQARDLEYVFIFENLKEIDLSLNNLSDINRLFRNDENLLSKRKSLMNYIKNRFYKKKHTVHLNNLKTINLNNCTLDSEKFIINLLNIKGLESINLSGIQKIDICRCLKNCKSKETIKKIEISNCLIFGSEIFQILNDFTSLEYLDISANYFNTLNEQFSFGNICNSLIYLNINRCDFKNLSAIGEFKKLVYLHASFNNFLNIPIDFNESLKESLKEVIMKSSQLNIFSLSALFNCKNIVKLDISKNWVQNIPDYFSFNDIEHSLKYLNIEFCNWNLNGLKAIARCSKLKILNASGNSFQDIGSDFKLNRSLLNSLNEVYLSDCKMNHYGLIAFTDCYNLEKLDVSFNSFEDLPSDYRINSNRLKELNIYSSKLKNLKAVTDCLYLKYLNANSNTFSDLPDNFSLGISRNSLEYLNLSRCELKSKNVFSITNCKRLKFLDLSLNDLSDEFSFGCSKESLIELHMRVCNLNYKNLKTVTDCRRLEKLIVFMNFLNNIPVEFSFGRSKYSLKKIDIGWCSLNIHGLKALASCCLLEDLSIQSSNLVSIPQDFDLKYLKNSLVRIDLSFSFIEPKLLFCLHKCSKLSFVDISNCKVRNVISIEEVFDLKNIYNDKWICKSINFEI